MQTLSNEELSLIAGGAGQSYDGFAKDLKNDLRADYKSLVCKGAGLKGGTELASQVYGDKASDADKIRASEMLTKYCNGGANLPAAAPAFPF
ncbi:MAG: hypothetical protein QM831_00880 [Kofleriaceae bacterium]